MGSEWDRTDDASEHLAAGEVKRGIFQRDKTMRNAGDEENVAAPLANLLPANFVVTASACGALPEHAEACTPNGYMI